MTEEYKTAEQIAWDKSKPVVQTIGYVFKGFYDVVASLFRVPTLTRRLSNKKTFFHTKNDATGLQEFLYMFGGVVGAVTDSFLFYEMLAQFHKGNSLPFGIWGMTNIASEIYELGRASGRKSKIEKKVEELK